MNPARQAAIGGGLPVAVPAMTVNRVCGSGAQAVVTIAQQIAAGEVEAGIAGGMENMDRAPYLMGGGRWGYRTTGPAQILDSMLTDGLNDAFSGEHSGWHTEDLVTRAQLSRDDQDRFAARSQQRFAAAQAAGRFVDEIVAVEVKGRKGPLEFAIDEAPRPDTTVETLARLKAAFRADGTITAGNAPGPQQRRRSDDRRDGGLCGTPRTRPNGPDRVLRDCGRRPRDVRDRPGAGGPYRARARQLVDCRHRAHRDQRSLRRGAARGLQVRPGSPVKDLATKKRGAHRRRPLPSARQARC